MSDYTLFYQYLDGGVARTIDHLFDRDAKAVKEMPDDARRLTVMVVHTDAIATWRVVTVISALLFHDLVEGFPALLDCQGDHNCFPFG
jgi:hypothetical protein